MEKGYEECSSNYDKLKGELGVRTTQGILLKQTNVVPNYGRSLRLERRDTMDILMDGLLVWVMDGVFR